MKAILARSPYTISIDETDQVVTKIEIRIWYNGDTKPTAATYILSKQIPSTTKRETIYNISPYIKDFFKQIKPQTTVIDGVEEKEMYCLVEVKTFASLDSIDYDAIDTIDFVGMNGFSNPHLGANKILEESVIYLTNPSIGITTNNGATVFSGSQNVPYFNILVDWGAVSGKKIRYQYKDLSGGNTTTIDILTDADPVGIYCLKVPYRNSGSAYANGNTIQVGDTSRDGGLAPLPTITYTTVCEPKYTPVRCDFINRFGGWQTIVFFKSQTKSFDFKNSDFKTLPENWDYNPSEAGTKSLNFEAAESIKLNTGWVAENYVDLLFDLCVSETVLLDGIPAKVKTKSMPYKTAIKDRNINYEIDFEYTYNLINDVQ